MGSKQLTRRASKRKAPETQKNCLVCNSTSSVHYHYGALTCSSCKMFFIRQVEKNRPFTGCENKTKCVSEKACRSCRFNKCKTVGMRLPLSPILEQLIDKNNEEVANLIAHLSYHHKRREYLFTNMFVDDDIGFPEAVGTNIQFKNRDLTTKIPTIHWCNYNNLLSINFFKTILNRYQFDDNDKVNKSQLHLLGNSLIIEWSSATSVVWFESYYQDDPNIILSKNFHVKASKFFYANRAAQSKKDEIITPDGQDLYDDLDNVPGVSAGFKCRIRYEMIGKIIEMNMTEEEFMMVTLIFFTNTALLGLSPECVEILYKIREKLRRLMFTHSVLQYQRNGPVRFAELLSMEQVLNRSHEDISAVMTLMSLSKSGIQFKKLLTMD